AALLAVYFEVDLHKKAGGRLSLPVTDGKNTMYSMLDWSNCPEVERIEGKVGGAWVFKGTRVPEGAFRELGVGRDRRAISRLVSGSHIGSGCCRPQLRRAKPFN